MVFNIILLYIYNIFSSQQHIQEKNEITSKVAEKQKISCFFDNDLNVKNSKNNIENTETDALCYNSATINENNFC